MLSPFLRQLDHTVSERSLLKHSFYVRWQEGRLSANEMRGYAKEYYPFEKEFPCFVSAVHSRCAQPQWRQLLLQNLMDEEAGETNHRILWLQFAEGLGLSRQQVEEHRHSDETEQLLRTFRQATAAGLVEGLAALYAYETQQPAVAATKISGLRAFYGIEDAKAVEFFSAHQKYDVEHSQTEAAILVDTCRDASAQGRAQRVVEEVCDALYDFLDGVEKRYQAA